MRYPLVALALLSGGCTGLIGDNSGSSANADALGFAPAPAAIRRLTSAEYVNTVRDVFGVEAQANALGGDVMKNGLQALGASSATLSSVTVEAAETSAFAIAEAALDGSALDSFCTPTDATDVECWNALAADLGRKAFRRPLTTDEVARYSTLGSTSATTLGSVSEGEVMLIAGLLQSPNFLFRAEVTEVDPNDTSRRRYDAHSLASRLSYFLTNSPPDAQLSALADAGTILEDATLESEARRLAQGAGYRAAIADFFRDWLHLEGLDGLQKDRTTFPGMTDSLGKTMLQDIKTSLAKIFDDGTADYRDIYTSPVAFADASLGVIYGVEVDGTFQQIDVPAEHGRVGLLGKPGFLALYGANTRSSPTLRGKFVRESILCEPVPPPPPDADTTVPEPDATSPTMRDRLTHHREGTCAACHRLMDPIGLTLESFDGIGAYRTQENGADIDLSGSIGDTEFTGLAGLAQFLHDDDAATICATRTMFRYASGHLETDGEEQSIFELVTKFQAAGYTLPGLMSAIATSPAFRYAAQETL